MKKTILVTGASGTVGYEVIKQLADNEQYRVIAFDVKTPMSVRKLEPLSDKISIVYADITQREAVEKVTHNVDFVIHLAAIIPPLADEKPDLAERVNVQGTKNLIESLQKNSPNAFFLYSSSISVYGDRLKTPLIKVSDPLIPSQGDEYAKTKIKTEQIIKQSNLNWSIFRLAAIMGNHKISGLMFHMPLDTSVEICTPSDTARAFSNAIGKEPLLNKRIFNLGGGENCRILYKDLLQKSFKIFGLGKVNFPDKAFAEKNFHCGYYIDGDDLEAILNFRRDDLKAYFRKVEVDVNPFVKFLTIVFRPIIKRFLLSKSEPYHAYKTGDLILKNRFFED